MVPIDSKPARPSSPLFSYPYARSREALATMARNGAPDVCHGYKLRYINPGTGGAPMPTIGAFMALLPAGFASRPYRSTDGTVYAVVEGEGETSVGETVIRWKPRDLFVVPAWHRHTHRAASEAVLFSFSDRPVQDVLGLWREERA
jgi:gentisate 1,2-dioxygenase